jgi:hypothetical protein
MVSPALQMKRQIKTAAQVRFSRERGSLAIIIKLRAAKIIAEKKWLYDQIYSMKITLIQVN